MSISRIMKWITGIFEACLAIPVIGGLFVISNGYSPLMVMLILHIITLVLSKRDQGPMIGSIIGIVTSCLAWIPILGFILHIITALALIITALVPDEKRDRIRAIKKEALLERPLFSFKSLNAFVRRQASLFEKPGCTRVQSNDTPLNFYLFLNGCILQTQ